MDEATAYIGLGSNVGNRSETLLAALDRIDALPGVELRQNSSFMETVPVGGPAGQRHFINAVAEAATSLDPHQLLRELQRIERTLGRDRANEERWGPRTCDLDILLFETLVLDDPELTIPHPRLHERLFVLRPLAEIAPSVFHPTLGKTIVQLLADAEQRP